MSIPNETLRKVLLELQNKFVEDNKKLTSVKTQIQTKERDKRLAELTKRELTTLDSDTRTYKSVGKAFIKTDLSVLMTELDTRVIKAEKELNDLDKTKKHLERNVNESQNALREITTIR
ncbi:5956_t:CDS:2 [Dentiscutata erythropus]|uniref:5956_t:CDS:1 n=1 Tax=Dentiscutata erythropus TaxID=1348616 RepID=A0A9N9F472_9GLOM|nr:5956_t:CDS:2 [Dentiscutata erythropus]